MRWVLRAMTFVIAVDPGPTPGIAFLRGDEFQAWIAPHWQEAVSTVERHLPRADALVCESFKIGGARDASSNATIEMIGMLRYLAWRHGREFVLQSPADAAAFGTTAKLRKMGWWTPGKADHARSATQHLLLYLTRTGAVSASALLD